jgi:hypothetical protein
LGPGQFFGDQGALRGQRGALTCHAVTQCALGGRSDHASRSARTRPSQRIGPAVVARYPTRSGPT